MSLSLSYSEPLLMRLFSFITLLFFSCLSLAAQDKGELITKLKTIEGWSLSITSGTTEGPQHQLPTFTPEVTAVFSYEDNSICHSPRLEFYPRAMKDTILFRQITTNRLSSQIDLRSQDYFVSKDYFIIAWAIDNSRDKNQCNFQKLKYSLIRDLDLKEYYSKTEVSRSFDATDLLYTDQEIYSIIEQTLNIPELDLYLHIDKSPVRVPLVLEQTSKVRASKLRGLKKFGSKVLILDKREINQRELKNSLFIDKWFMHKGLLNIQLHYPIEDIFVLVIFEKIKNEWGLKNYQIIEY